MADDIILLKERVDRRIQLLSILIALLGLLMLYVSTPVHEAGYKRSGTLLEESGAAIFISGVLAVLWEKAGKRAFADEILAKANMSRDLAEAGIDVITHSFKDDRINWDQLFKNACRLDLFVAYGHSWRNTQSERIDRLLSDAAATIRVILPDPEDDEVVKNLSGRFEMKPESVKQEIDETRKFFERRVKKAKGKVELYFTRITPVFSFYRFNNKVVFALYNHRRGQQLVPSFICDKEGFLFQFFSAEFEGICGDTRTRRVDLQQIEPEPAKPA
jgi:hypothetical protein